MLFLAQVLAFLSIAGAETSETKPAVQPERVLTGLANQLAIVKFAKELKEHNWIQDDPASLSRYITENVLQKADETKVMLQGKIDTARSNVVACYRVVTGAGPDQDAATDDLNANDAKEEACETLDREAMSEEMKICESFAQQAMGFQPPKVKKVKHSLKLFDQALKQYYDFYPLFMKAKDACWKATGNEHSQHAHCMFRKHYVDKAYCALRHNMTLACAEYDKCFKAKAAEMQEVEAKVRVLANHTKKVYQGLYCMAENTGFKFATEVDTVVPDLVDLGVGCKEVDTSHLTVTFPEVPTQEVCSEGVKTTNHLEAKIKCADDAAPTELTSAAVAPEAAVTPSAGPGGAYL